MQENDISALIAKEIERGETNRVEFKEDIPEEHRKVIKTAVAFSNSAGGHILFGVTNDRVIVGIPDDVLFSKMDQITNMIVDSCQPMVAPDIFIASVGGKNIIVVDVLPGHRCPYFIKSEGVERGTYIRVSATSVIADEDMRLSLQLRGRNISFDSIDCPSVPIDEDSVRALCRHLSSFDREVEEVNLVNMGVIRSSLNEYTATNAYALLTTNPFLYAHVQCARFRGEDDSLFVDRKEYDGCIIDQALNATNFVINHINVGAKIEKVIREDIYEIPKEAIREAIVNAVVHRDYSMRGVSIFVKVFDDRVEIESPGLSLGVDVMDPFSGRSIVRNEVIAAVFKYTGLIEAYGTGVRKIINTCRAAGMPDPIFEEDGFYFKVTFERSAYSTQPMDVNQQKDAILRAISIDGTMSQSRIAEVSGVSLSSVKRMMSAMQKDGIIERSGTRRNSAWRIVR